MSTTKAQVFAVRPLHWWEIMASPGVAALPFQGFFTEARALETWSFDGDAAQESPGSTDPPVPVEEVWGEHESLIEEWFDAGEALAQSELEVDIEEPERWEKAVQWLVSLASAVGLRGVMDH